MSGSVSDLPFDLGRQMRVVLVDENGNDVQLAKVTNFDAKETLKEVTVEPLMERPEEIHVPMNWKGTFEISRRGGALDILMTQRSNNFWNGTGYRYWTMFTYMSENDGSTTSFKYNKVSVGYADAGSYKATDDVKQKLQFSAQSREQINQTSN